MDFECGLSVELLRACMYVWLRLQPAMKCGHDLQETVRANHTVGSRHNQTEWGEVITDSQDNSLFCPVGKVPCNPDACITGSETNGIGIAKICTKQKQLYKRK